MTKTLLNNKLKSYSAVVGSILATSAAADAQVIYTDINPDNVTTITNDQFTTYDIDFNADATVDVVVGTYGYIYGGTAQVNYTLLAIAAGGTNGLMGSLTDSLPTPVTAGAAIGGAGTFVAEGNTGNTQFGTNLSANGFGNNLFGNFGTGADQYVGARFTIGAATHYGWIRMVIPMDASTVTIKDFAYNGTANTAINAGDAGGLGVVQMSDAQWFASVSGNSVIVSTKVDGDVKIFDAAGRLITTGKTENGIAVINMDGAQAGMFIVSIENGAAIGTKKVILN